MSHLGFSRFVEFAPGQKYTNDQLPVHFPNIEERTDIQARSIAGEKDSIVSMGIEAAKQLCTVLNIKGADCGGLVLASCAQNEGIDHEISKFAKQIAHALGIHGSVRGVNFACSGFPAAVK